MPITRPSPFVRIPKSPGAEGSAQALVQKGFKDIQPAVPNKLVVAFVERIKMQDVCILIFLLVVIGLQEGLLQKIPADEGS